MKDIVFYRKIKIIINGVRSYGIQHCSNGNAEALMTDPDEKKNFIIRVHTGFSVAQNTAIFLLQKILKEKKQLKADLKQYRRDKNKEKIKETDELLNKAKYQEMVVRKAMDAIAWQLFQCDITIMRRLYYGQELIDITDSNLDSELQFIENYRGENPEAFVLISDLTSFIQVGDVVAISPQKGVTIGELKEGDTNHETYQIIDNFEKNGCPYYLAKEMENMDPKKREQLYRNIKQIARQAKVMKTIREGKGEDLLTGLPVSIDQDEIQLNTFTEMVRDLLEKCTRKGYAITVIEGCLLLGVYDTDKFPSNVFDLWAEAVGVKMPGVDLRSGVFDPLGCPVYLHPFKDSDILDIIRGKKIVKMAVDIEAWMRMFEEDGIKWTWLSKKETARINADFKGKSKIFTLEDKGIRIENGNGVSQLIGQGVFSRMFTSFNTPSSIKKLLVTVLERTEKRQGSDEGADMG